MSKLFEAVKKNDNETETLNGCKANKSTLNDCLDLFFHAQALRKDQGACENHVLDAYKEDPLLALRLLFYLRDIRGNGQGERVVFRNGLRAIARFDKKPIIKNLKHIPFFGRWDDLLSLYGIDDEIDTAIAEIVSNQADQDLKAYSEDRPQDISLLWKWLPSENASNKETVALAKKVRQKIFHLDAATYRKTLSKFRRITKVLEPYLMRKDYTFDYSKIPSKAAQKYKDAFLRNDKERYTEYAKSLAKAVETGSNDVKINVSTLYPVDIIHDIMVKYGAWISSANETQLSILNSSWKSLKDYFNDETKDQNWLVMADVSGSMTYPNYWPMAASVGLAMYTAEHNNGLFADKFITFETNPKFVSIDRKWTIEQKINKVVRADWGGSTNIEAAFKMILDAAVKENIPESEMPTALLIISDMQFNYCCQGTGLDMIRSRYEKAGYKLPKVVFWNVASQYMANTPATKDDDGIILFGGYSPSIVNEIVNNSNPVAFMLEVVNNQRYNCIEL